MPAPANAIASSSTAPAVSSPEAVTTDATSGADGGRKPKRREPGVDPSLILSEGRSKRRRTPTPPPPKAEKEPERDDGPKDRERASRLGMEIYNQVMAQRDKDGTVMSKPFIKLPPPKLYADYYEIIKAPMSLENVLHKLKTQQYETLEAVRNDFGLIWNNAKRYNIKDSTLFLYAKKLHKLTRTLYDELSVAPLEKAPVQSGASVVAAAEESDSDREGEPVSSYNVQTPGGGDDDGDDGDNRVATTSSPGQLDSKNRRKRGSYFKNGPTVYKLIKPALKTLINATSKSRPGHQLATMFLHLPDRDDFPDYYQVITAPISLEQIEKKSQARSYQNYNEFIADVQRMCDNAMYYNVEESEVYQDAAEIKGRLASIKADIEHRMSHPNPVKTIKLKMPSAQPSIPAPQVSAPTAAAVPQQSQAPPRAPAQPLARPAPPPAPVALPGLPRGVVNADVVASMNRHSQAEQVAWASSLNGQQQGILQQLLVPARATVAQAPIHTARQLADVPAANRLNVPPALDRSRPLVRYMTFAFRPQGSGKMLSTRLQNWRGVTNHAVTVSLATDRLELEAFASQTTGSGENALGTVLPAKASTELVAKANGTVVAASAITPSSQDSRRWSIAFPTQLASMVIEINNSVSASGETKGSVVYVSRQV